MSRLLSRLFQSIDWVLLLPFLALAILSIFTVSSATSSSPYQTELSSIAQMQLMYFGVGLVLILVVSRFSIWSYYRSSVPLYILSLAALALVLVIGVKVAGSRRWLVFGPMRGQPSEIMKIALILYMARWLQVIQPFERVGFLKLIKPLVAISLPAVLILVEPDLGTALVLLGVGMLMMLLCRVDRRLLLGSLMLCILMAPVAYFFVLKDYQRQRIVSFLDPNRDPQGAGYNAIQSMVAIGSGRVWGKGFGKGTQSRLDFIPEHHTDFIFSSFSEEWGFVGLVLLLGLYGVLIFRVYTLASQGPTTFATLICLGYSLALTIQIVVNIGMVSGLLPVVGVALPFMSYGGSSLIANSLALGMCMGIKRQQILFKSEM